MRIAGGCLASKTTRSSSEVVLLNAATSGTNSASPISGVAWTTTPKFQQAHPATHVVPLLFGRLVAPAGGPKEEAPIFADLIAQATNRTIPIDTVIDSSSA